MMTMKESVAGTACSAFAKPALFCVRCCRVAAALASVTMMMACGGRPAVEQIPPRASATTRLKDVFRDDFRVGTAVSPRQFDERDTTDVGIITRHFNTI